MDGLTRALVYFIPAPFVIFGLNGLISHFTSFQLHPFAGMKVSILLVVFGLMLGFVIGNIESKYINSKKMTKS